MGRSRHIDGRALEQRQRAVLPATVDAGNRDAVPRHRNPHAALRSGGLGGRGLRWCRLLGARGRGDFGRALCPSAVQSKPVRLHHELDLAVEAVNRRLVVRLDDVLRVDLVLNDSAERMDRLLDRVLLKTGHDIEREGVGVVREEQNGHVLPLLLLVVVVEPLDALDGLPDVRLLEALAALLHQE